MREELLATLRVARQTQDLVRVDDLNQTFGFLVFGQVTLEQVAQVQFPILDQFCDQFGVQRVPLNGE